MSYGNAFISDGVLANASLKDKILAEIGSATSVAAFTLSTEQRESTEGTRATSHKIAQTHDLHSILGGDHRPESSICDTYKDGSAMRRINVRLHGIDEIMHEHSILTLSN